jgi:hypothetical protein
MFTVKLENVLAVGKTGLSAVLQEQVNTVIAAKTVNDQANACDDVHHEHRIE